MRLDRRLDLRRRTFPIGRRAVKVFSARHDSALADDGANGLRRLRGCGQVASPREQYEASAVMLHP